MGEDGQEENGMVGEERKTTPSPSNTAMVGGESMEMAENMKDAEKVEGKEDKKGKGKDDTKEDEGSPALPSVGMIELVCLY
jgi:hypothetical protein